MKRKFEYELDDIRNDSAVLALAVVPLEEYLRLRGQDGWQLVTIHNDHLIFIREKEVV